MTRERHRETVSGFGTVGGPAAKLVDYLFQQPIVTVSMVAENCACAWATANKLVKDFERMGLLRETTGQKRNRRYRYDPHLALFETPPTTGQEEDAPAGSGN